MPHKKHISVSEFDQLGDVLPGLQTRPLQLSRGKLDLVVDSVIGRDFNVARMSLTQKISDQSTIEPGTLGFVVVEKPQLWCGIEVTIPSLIVVEPGREHRSVLGPGFQSLEYSFSNESIARHPIVQILQELRLTPENSILPLDNRMHALLRNGVDAALACVVDDIGDSAVRENNIKKLQLDNLHEVLVQRLSDKPWARVKYRSRYKLASAALSQIDQHGPLGLTAVSLAERLRVTRRALELSFRSVLDTSPTQYLIAYRLSMVKDELLTGTVNIVEAAYKTGFNDPSRFAQQYKRLYHELPSQTLKRCGKL